ncbi:MAG: hypothetical protein GEU75_09075 [Dehalococcoidia bacterium]|nr:hypothetical protein [Dehalococcoidia bacterium]
MAEAEERYRRDVSRTYRGEGIVVLWEPKLCIHITNCIRHLPQVFNAGVRPWIDASAASAEEIAAAVESCPTGALSYERTDGAPGEQAGETTTVEPRTNGPLFLRGRIEVRDPSGRVLRTATRVALCRCGYSGNKPYCDLSHRAIDFKA